MYADLLGFISLWLQRARCLESSAEAMWLSCRIIDNLPAATKFLDIDQNTVYSLGFPLGFVGTAEVRPHRAARTRCRRSFAEDQRRRGGDRAYCR